MNLASVFGHGLVKEKCEKGNLKRQLETEKMVSYNMVAWLGLDGFQ